MAGQTKMIIITSDEDIIRQFSLNKTTNTQMIDLNNGKQITPMTKHNSDIMNLAFFAELSETNSTHDQLYKRVLDSPNRNQSKPVKVRKKSLDVICMICGDHAVGFNYDVLSCASCKAFFRRNAHQNLEKMRCLKGQNQCSVAHETRPKCSKCRLDRCFSVGMRKDFIVSEEDKQRKRKRLEENRAITSQRLSTLESIPPLSASNHLSTTESVSPTLDEIDRLLMDLDNDNSSITFPVNTDSNEMEEPSIKSLSVEDLIVVENIRSSFLSFFGNDYTEYSSMDVSNQTSALICWSQIANQTSLRFISFFRQLEEFEGLNGDDRFILIKYNILSLFPITRCFDNHLLNICFSYEVNDDAMRRRQFYMLCFESNGIRDLFLNLIVSLVQITKHDPTVLSLLLIILFFSPGLSMMEDEPSLKDSLAVNRAQVYYIEILWNYLIDKQGETQTYKQFTQLLNIIFRIQSATKSFRQFFRDQLGRSNTVDEIAPLMQTVLHIS